MKVEASLGSTQHLSRCSAPRPCILAQRVCSLQVQLPQNYFKEMMQNYSIPKKAELLASLNTEKKDLYLKKFADVGSSVRDIIELELENINSNPATISRIENQKDQIWKDFVTYVRSCIRSNEAIKPEMSQLINDWSHTLINK